MMDVELPDAASALQGKVTGVIIPPPDIRTVVDKTAMFVAKNGKSFETRILNSGEGKTAKFNFLKAYDPYNAYYEMKIREFEEGSGTTAPDNKVTSEAAVQRDVEETKGPGGSYSSMVGVSTSASSLSVIKTAMMNPLARFSLSVKGASGSSSIEDLPQYDFQLVHPSGLSALDVDIIKLTAQYTAVSGREFLGGLAQREQRNPQFDFLKPTHMLFSYFTSLVDAYAKVLQPSTYLQELVQQKNDKFRCLEHSVHRWEITRQDEERRRRDVSVADAERSAFHSIDWHDFVVVETIDFAEDELLMRATEGMTLESSSLPLSVPPPPPPPPHLPLPLVNPEKDDDIAGLNIVSGADYIPRVAYTNAPRSVATMIDPVSGRAIPVDQFEEHMRIQLMDPKWREQQARFLEKQQDSGFAAGSSIADSLTQFAKQRGDIFGSAEGEEARIAQEEARRRKRIEETNRLIWDGHQSSVAAIMQQRIEQSMAAPVSLPISSGPGIGPSLAPSYSGSALGMPPAPPLAQTDDGSMPARGRTMVLPAWMTEEQKQEHVSMPPPPPPPPPPNPGMQITMPINSSGLSSSVPLSGMQIPMQMPMSVLIPGMQMQMPLAMPPAMNQEDGPGPTKKPRQDDDELVPEAEFAARFPTGIIEIGVLAPIDSSNANFNLRGQEETVSVNIMATIKQLKDLLTEKFGGMPGNKMQLKGRLGFLKDTQSLASLNIGDKSKLELSLRSRGGKK